MRLRDSLLPGLFAVAAACGPQLDTPVDDTSQLLSGVISITAAHSGKCADIEGASTAAGARVIQWPCSGHDNQRWTVKGAGGGAFNLVSVASDKCMDVQGGSGTRGAGIVQMDCDGSDTQKWKTTSAGSGRSHLISVPSGLCLDVKGASTDNRAIFEVWTCHNSANQSFSLSGGNGGTGGAGGAGGAGGSGGSGGDPPGAVFRKANLTNFTSYPEPGSEECIKFSGCEFEGEFAALDGKQSKQWVMSHNIVAVHERDFSKFKLKTLRIKQGSHQIDAVVYDECADADCDGCCTQNAKGAGFLIDMESFTVERFGSGDGVVDWTCLDCK